MSDRHPPFTGTSPAGQNPVGSGGRIIRRAPTGAFPISNPIANPIATGVQRVPPAIQPSAPPLRQRSPSITMAVSACVLALIGCWATSVVSTDLIASWWQTDRLFCVAVGFLTVVFAATTLAGVIMLLLRRSPGRLLIVVGAVVALLTFGSLFLAGARVPWLVHAIPVIHLATVVTALHPATVRWLYPAL